MWVLLDTAILALSSDSLHHFAPHSQSSSGSLKTNRQQKKPNFNVSLQVFGCLGTNMNAVQGHVSYYWIEQASAYQIVPCMPFRIVPMQHQTLESHAKKV